MWSRKFQSIVMIVAISVIGTCALSMFLYTRAAAQLKKEVHQVYAVSLTNIGSQVANFLGRINQAIVQMEKTREYKDWTSAIYDTPENNLPIDLVHHLSSIHASLDYIDNVTLMDTASGKQYATNGKMNVSYGNYGEHLAKFVDLHVPQAVVSVVKDGVSSTVYIQSLPLFQLEPSGYLLFHLNRNFFGDLLQNPRQDGQYLILKQEGDLVRYGRAGIPELAGPGGWPELLDRYRLDGTNEPAAFTVGGQFYVLYSPKDSAWSYVYAVPEKLLLQPILRLRNMTLWATLVILLVTLILYTLSIQWSWKGWKQLYGLLADSGEAERRDNFEHLYVKVHGMVQSHNQLQRRMNEILPEIKEAFIRNLLEKGCRTAEEQERLRQYGIPLGHGAYSCICVEIDDYRTMRDLYNERDLYHFEYGIQCVVREALEEVKLPGTVLNSGQGRLIGIVQIAREPDAALLGEALETMRGFVGQYFPFTISIGVSRLRRELRHLNLSYREAAGSLKQKLIAGPGQIVYYSAPSDRSGGLFFAALGEIRNDIVHAIRATDREAAYGALQRLFEIKAERMDYRRLQHDLVDMTMGLFRELSADYPNRHPSIDEMVQLSTLKEWADWIAASCIDRLIGEVREQQQKQYGKIAGMLTHYIEDHLEEDLRLNEVCQQLGVPASLSQQALKEIHGATFNEYLFRRRIERSKAWLKHTPMTLQEISTRLYYSNAQNFSRAFKKYVGVPPGEFRRHG